jgi:hypothetical protein
VLLSHARHADAARTGSNRLQVQAQTSNVQRIKICPVSSDAGRRVKSTKEDAEPFHSALAHFLRELKGKSREH